MDIKSILNDAISELNESAVTYAIKGATSVSPSQIIDAATLGGLAGGGAYLGKGAAEEYAAAEQEAAERAAEEEEALRLANRTPLEKVRDMGVEGYEKAKAALSGAYDDVSAQVQAHPYMAAAIPGALLAGAGALALRRRQMAAKNQ